MLNNLNEIRERYLQDSLPKRLGALAADLARVVSFAKTQITKMRLRHFLRKANGLLNGRHWTLSRNISKR